MRLALTLVAFLSTLVVTAVVVFFAVLFLSGPHGGALPSSLATATLAVGWACVVLIPLLAACWTWRRLRRNHS